ncbi:COG4223 family protein [Devosia sediminis]|uniref:Inner membrane protein n=1 Tax=Devosia sediminis TaxID=2798801 RepID=A0A934IY27_9HYPH|nr:hypothetical protein [Devosia sediminis]MBJ3786517.1 hypothetical protein [Devosia sediminis]
MAETPGKDTPATDAKSTGKAGPVKPPVLEGTARPTTSGKPSEATAKPAEKTADKPAASAATTTPKPSSVPPKRPDTEEKGGSGVPWLAGLAGGLVGLGAAYGLAWFGLWPSPAATPAPADPRLAQFATAIPELETATGTVQDELATLTSRVATLESAAPETAAAAEAPAATPDPASAEDLAALSARVEELSAAAGSSDSAADVEAVEAELASLQADVAQTQAQLAQTQQQMAALAQSANESAGSSAATIRLPLIFSGLESAFAGGRAYETELAALRQALPDTVVPEPVAARAANGLPRPDAVAAGLSSALPAMLAGRPVNADAGWQDATADWFRGIIAMRPSGAVEGDGPDAMIARLEAAVARRDFVAAKAELDALPAPMRNAAGSVADDIDSLAGAQTFLAQLRSQALNGESGA